MQNNENNNQRPVRPQMQPGQRPVRPQMQQGQRPVRPQMQQGVRPEREQSPNRNQQRPVRPEFEQSQSRNRQRPVRPEFEQSPNRRRQQYEYEQSPNRGQQIDFGSDNNYEDFNSEIVNDTVAENKARGKKQKVVKQKKEITPEQKKKRLIIGGSVLAALLVFTIAFKIISGIIKENNQHINIADMTQQETDNTNEIEQDTNMTEDVAGNNVDNTDDIQDTQQEEIEAPPVVNIDAKECSESSPLDLNEYTYMNLIVNTKTAQDKAYVDREAKVYTRLSNVVTGYNNVAKYIDEYNKTNTQNKSIKLPEKLEYYRQSNGTEMVMLEFEMLYPADFPTSASSGYVFKIPQASIEVFGTLEEIDSDEITQAEGYDSHNYIVVDDIIYNVSKITDISVYERNADKGIKIGEPIVFRYITALPVNASSDVYGFKINIDLDVEDLGKDSATYWFKGQPIKASEELLESQQTLEQESLSNEQTDEQTDDENTDNVDESDEQTD